MRLWTVHPMYLDAKGLTALWREGLLARAVLHGKTRGYANHPQLQRFRAHPDPLRVIDAYLAEVLTESRRRGYKFDGSKIDTEAQAAPIEETVGQLEYEWQHLLGKLKRRAPRQWAELRDEKHPQPHPLFLMTDGPVKDWEKVTATPR